MALHEYNKKRKFDKTPEPPGKEEKRDGKLRFVVQKHVASRLHYDFRLEIDGVLKSWAVPKGVPTTAGEKHLAMMVEDHPLEYRNFEGIIPEGEYGGGTVMLWDEGTYEVTDLEGNKVPDEEQEKLFHEEIKGGDLKVELHGKKLKGSFALVRFKRAGDNAWLMLKHKDEYSGKKITDEDNSVRSGRTLSEITEQEQPKQETKLEPAEFPGSFDPMLATLVNELPNSDEWIYEPKWDGYRVLAYVNQGNVNLLSRNKISFNERFPEVFEALSGFPVNVVLDGEVIALDEKGHSSFQSLQNYLNTRTGRIVYHIFDILYVDQFNLCDVALIDRKKLLKQTIKPTKLLKVNESFNSLKEAQAYVKEEMLEGIIAKLKSSHYVSERSGNWQKLKVLNTDDFIICGYTKPKGERQGFGSLILGEKKYGKFKYVGLVGTGIDNKIALELKPILDKLKTDEPVFESVPTTTKVDQWIKPVLSCQVRYVERTSEGLLRQAVFEGIRLDK